MTKEQLLQQARHYLVGYNFRLGLSPVLYKRCIIYINAQDKNDYITIETLKGLIK